MNKIIKTLVINIAIVIFAVLAIKLLTTFGNNNTVPTNSNKMQQTDLDIVKAPQFTAIDSNGNTHQLSDYLGKIVVLEWKNHLCPFVKKYYSKGHMQQLQNELTKKGVIWLSINSSAKGKQGYLSSNDCNNQIKKERSLASAVLLDTQGDLGRLYNAKTTPHMFVIDQAGTLAYQGAIDSIRSASTADIPNAINYVNQAVTELLNNQTVSVPLTAPYGCSVKY